MPNLDAEINIPAPQGDLKSYIENIRQYACNECYGLVANFQSRPEKFERELQRDCDELEDGTAKDSCLCAAEQLKKLMAQEDPRQAICQFVGLCLNMQGPPYPPPGSRKSPH